MEISFFCWSQKLWLHHKNFELRIILPNWVEFLIDHKIVTVFFAGGEVFSLSSTSKQTQKPQENGVLLR